VERVVGELPRRVGPLHGYEHLSFAPLFGHQYSHTLDRLSGHPDPAMRDRGIDYFENTRRAVYAPATRLQSQTNG
jgi:hypothetical protein